MVTDASHEAGLSHLMVWLRPSDLQLVKRMYPASLLDDQIFRAISDALRHIAREHREKTALAYLDEMRPASAACFMLLHDRPGIAEQTRAALHLLLTP